MYMHVPAVLYAFDPSSRSVKAKIDHMQPLANVGSISS